MLALNVNTARFTKTLRLFKLALVIGLALFHINYALFTEAFQARNNDYPMLVNAYETGKNELCARENEASNSYLVSNWAYVFRIECASRRVKQIEPVTANIAYNKDMQKLIVANEDYNNLMDAITDIKNRSMNRPIHIGFFPGRFGIEASDFPLSKNDQEKLINTGWVIIRNDEHGLLVHYPKETIE